MICLQGKLPLWWRPGCWAWEHHGWMARAGLRCCRKRNSSWATGSFSSLFGKKVYKAWDSNGQVPLFAWVEFGCVIKVDLFLSIGSIQFNEISWHSGLDIALGVEGPEKDKLPLSWCSLSSGVVDGEVWTINRGADFCLGKGRPDLRLKGRGICCYYAVPGECFRFNTQESSVMSWLRAIRQTWLQSQLCHSLAVLQ